MHQIRYFLAAANVLSFTRAAELCHVSQPALTTAIKKLEAQLGNPLFNRDGRQVSLSEFGRKMQPHLLQIMEKARAAEAVAKDYRLLNQSPVRLGVMSSVGPIRLAGVLAAFEQQVPGVDLAVSDDAPEALAAQLENDEIDMAILNPLEGLGGNYHTEPLYTEDYQVILPPNHALCEREAVPLQALSGLPYVDRLSCELREIVMGVCADRGIQLYARFRSQREDWVESMVQANVGFAFMPEFSILNPATVRRPLIDPAVTRTISLMTVPGRTLPPACQDLIRVITSYRWT